MTETPIKPTPFPGGFADAGWRYACVRDRSGRLVAVDLQTGAMLCRTTDRYRALIATSEELIALAEQDFLCASFGWDASGGGAPQWSSDPLPLPDWARAPGADLAFSAQLRGSTVEVAWTARTRYKGGAAPSAQVLKQATRDQQGVFAVDRPSGAVHAIASTHAVWEPDLQAAAADPNVLEHVRHGDRIYELVVERDAAKVRTVLRAHNASSEASWQLIIDEGPAQAPRARRA